jgi:Holliday junction resolvase RusA-like endonuclease
MCSHEVGAALEAGEMSRQTTPLRLPPDVAQEVPSSTHELVLRLVVPGEPVAKGRPRFTRKGGVYTPTRTRQAEDVIRGMVIAVTPPADRSSRRLETGPLVLTCRFYRATGRTADTDNLVKLVKDALNGIVWQDDRQVVQLHAARFDRQPNPRTEIAVYRMVT